MCLQDVKVVKDTAAQAVAEFIRSPDLFQFDLFESPAINQLKGDAKYGHLYQLLEIVLNGDLQASVCFCLFDNGFVLTVAGELVQEQPQRGCSIASAYFAGVRKLGLLKEERETSVLQSYFYGSEVALE